MLALLERTAEFRALSCPTTIHHWDALALEKNRKTLDYPYVIEKAKMKLGKSNGYDLENSNNSHTVGFVLALFLKMAAFLA